MARPTRNCRHCGTPIGDAPYARVRGDCCCENCFLTAREPGAQSGVAGETTAALIEALAAAIDARARETGLHSKRVACHTLVLARRFTGDAAQLRQIYWGALLHDLGKIGIPDAILLKQAPLSAEEWQVMRQHH